MSYEPKYLKLYKRPDSYIGATWFDYYPVAGCSRDSDHIEQSNYNVIWAALAPLSTEMEDGESSVTWAECSHWAVGWVRTIYVHRSNEAALRVADELVGRLQDYPVLDEEDLSRREWEAACIFWKHSSVSDRLDAIKRSHCRGVSMFAARRAEFPQGDDNGALFEYCR